jgi:hypothetical protein
MMAIQARDDACVGRLFDHIQQISSKLKIMESFETKGVHAPGNGHQSLLVPSSQTTLAR